MGRKINIKNAKVSKLSFDAAVYFSAAEGEKELTGFNIEAYTGAPVDRWWGKLAIAVSGIKAKEQMPIFRDHDRGKIVGYSNSFQKDESFIVNGVFSKQTEAAKEVMGLAAEGFPWQASIGVKPLTIVEIRENTSMYVNGQEIFGPAEVWLESEVIETSFVPLGADGNTSVTVFSEVEEKAASAANKHDKRSIMELEKLTLEELQKARPDLVKAIADEATAGHDEELKQAMKKGSDDMLASIKSKLALSVPGHEKLSEELAYNPEISETEASKRILDAVRDEKETFAKNFEGDAPKPAKQPSTDVPNDENLTGEEALKAKWDKDKYLRAEFAGDYEVYLAYMNDQEGVKVKTLKDRGDK